MRKQLLLAGMLLAVLVMGCSHQKTIVGTWSGMQTTRQGYAVKSTWQYTADGKNTMSIAFAGGPHGAMTIGSTGTYTVNGSTMTQTILTMSEPGRTVTIPHPVTSTFQYTLNGDTLNISGVGITPFTLTRQST